MFCRDFMPRTNDAALQERECGLDTVRRNVSVNVDAVVMVYSPVDFVTVKSGLSQCSFVSGPFVRHDEINVAADIFLDVLRQRAGLHVLGMEETEFAAALLESDHDFLLIVLAALPVFAALDSTNKGFIYFYNAVQWFRIDFLHRRADAMAEIPCRLVGDAKDALQLIGAHALLRLTEKVDAQEPLPQGQVGIIEDRSCCDGELIAAIIAIKLVAFFDLRNLDRRATRAHNRVRPAECFKVLAALLLAAELLNQSAKINGVFHA